MAYTWITYNTQTGALGAHSQTQSPMVQTTTVTVGTDAPKVTTTSTTTLTPSTNTTTSETDGVTTTTTVTIEFDPNLIHTGQAIIGPFDGVTAVMTADEQAAYATPQAYLYQSGAFVANSAYPAMQLAQAMQAQVTAIEAGMNATLAGGFTSSANGTAIVYGYAASDIQHMQGIATASLLNVETWPIAYANIEGAEVALTQAQFTQLVTDANTFNWAQIKQVRTLIASIETATTVADVQAVVWQAATY